MQLCVFPVFILVRAHIERAILNDAQTNIIHSYPELPVTKAHGLAAITTTSALMEHERAVDGPEFSDERDGFRADSDPWNGHGD